MELKKRFGLVTIFAFIMIMSFMSVNGALDDNLEVYLNFQELNFDNGYYYIEDLTGNGYEINLTGITSNVLIKDAKVGRGLDTESGINLPFSKEIPYLFDDDFSIYWIQTATTFNDNKANNDWNFKFFSNQYFNIYEYECEINGCAVSKPQLFWRRIDNVTENLLSNTYITQLPSEGIVMIAVTYDHLNNNITLWQYNNSVGTKILTLPVKNQYNAIDTLNVAGEFTNIGQNYLDEFAIWKGKALTQSEMNELYNSGDYVSLLDYINPPVTYECSDLNDNDVDGLADYPYDSGCDSATDTSESPIDPKDNNLYYIEDFDIDTTNCQSYPFWFRTFGNGGAYTLCNTQDSILNIEIQDGRLYIPLPHYFPASYRTTYNYSVNARIRINDISSGTSRFEYTSDEDFVFASPTALKQLALNSNDQLSFGGSVRPEYNLSWLEDQWFDWTIVHNATDNRVYHFFNGTYVGANQVIDNIGLASSPLAFKIEHSDSNLLDTFEVSIDSVAFFWGQNGDFININGCNDGLDNDEDTFIDEDDPDCLTGTEEIIQDFYPAEILTNLTFFEDDFDNNNALSEGWTISTNCYEEIGGSGDSVIHNRDIGNCLFSQEFDLGLDDNIIFDLNLYPITFGFGSYFNLKNSDTDYIQHKFLNEPPLDTTGRVVYLPLDTDFLDDSGLGNDGAGGGNVYIDPLNGYYDGTAVFDGNNDAIAVGDSISLDITQNVTGMAYVYIDTLTGGGAIFVKGTPPFEYGLIYQANGSLYSYMGGVAWNTGYTLTTGQWYHVAFTRDFSTGNLSVYVNGNYVNSRTQAGLIPNQASNLEIGAYSTTDHDGYIDEVMIFNRVLSSSEILGYNNGILLEITGYGNCDVSENISLLTFNKYNLNNSYDYKWIMDLENDETSIYASGQELYSFIDPDCFVVGDTKEVEFYLDQQGDIEIDYFSINLINSLYPCYNGVDDDADGYTDYPDDPDCTDPYQDEDTFNTHQCNDGVDNDGDGYIDYPDDLACETSFGDDEYPRQGTLCQEADCRESTGCIFFDDFECEVALSEKGYITNPTWIAGLVEPFDWVNTFSSVILNEFVKVDVTLQNGSVVRAETGEYRRVFGSNTRDYPEINHEFSFFFDTKPFQGTTTLEGDITLSFYNTLYNPSFQMFAVKLYPKYNDATTNTDVDVYLRDYLGSETYVGESTISNNQNYGKFNLNVVAYPYEDGFRVKWVTGGGEFESALYPYEIFTYNSPDRVKILVDAYPSLPQGETYQSDVNMYLNKINIHGDDSTSTTICSTWNKPIFLKEDFNGYLENCGWSVYETGVFNDGRLYFTDNQFQFYAYKDFSPLYSSDSRYFTIDLTAIVYDYVDGRGYTYLSVYDDDNTEFLGFAISEDATGQYGTIEYYSDGSFHELETFLKSDIQRIIVIFDFDNDNYDILLTNSQATSLEVGSDLPLIDDNINPNSLSRVRIFGYQGEYALDNLVISATDDEGNAVAVSDDPNTIITDPFPDRAGNMMCGYFYDSLTERPKCIEDSDCESGVCLISGECSRFDYTYCDEKEMTRGNMCIASAVLSCTLEGTADLLLNNFILVIVAVIIIMFIAYLIIIFKA